MRNQGFFVDGDNLPVPDNIPDAVAVSFSVNENSNDVMKEWEHDGLCYRKVTEARDYKASLKKYCTDELRFTKLQYF